jgi:curved DNA-binding protein CbpA
MTDYYAILGVPTDADEETIKTKYRKLAKECHPDLHKGDKAAEARFKEIGEAWEVLSDPAKRAKYDNGRAPKKGASKRKPGAPVGDVDFSKVMGQFDSFFGKAVTPPTGGKQQKNPLDATDLFEKYMGMGKK